MLKRLWDTLDRLARARESQSSATWELAEAVERLAIAHEDLVLATAGRALSTDEGTDPDPREPPGTRELREWLASEPTWQGRPMDARHHQFIWEAFDDLLHDRAETSAGEPPRVVLLEFGVPDHILEIAVGEEGRLVP